MRADCGSGQNDECKMSDDLITEIEQFLANDGKPPEPTPQERMMAAFAQFAEASKPAVDAFAKAIQEMFAALQKVFRPYLDALVRIYEECQRDQVQERLEAWWVPSPVARWVAVRWPRRWLPALVLPPPDFV